MLKGLLICSSWYLTILTGFYVLYCPVMYLMFLNHVLYRKLVDFLFCLWELYPVALFQWCCRTKLHHFGDYVDPDETNIIIMNHRTRVDWNYVWIALYHATHGPTNNTSDSIVSRFITGKSKIKYVLKDEIKNVPGMGWIMQLNFFLYVKRNWREDQVSLTQFVDYYKIMKKNTRVVLFPEGTDLSKDNIVKSELFALANNLPVYKHVLHPRTTGFAVLCTQLRSAGLKSVYDVTVAYDNPPQTEMDMLRGNIPNNVYFHCKKYAITELPADDEGLRLWLQERWTEKEKSLHNFFTEGSFIDKSKGNPEKRLPRSLGTAEAAFIFWILLVISFIYYAISSVIFQFWIMYHTLLFIFVSWYFGGFHVIQYKLVENMYF